MSDDKPDLSQFMPEGWEGKYPPCQIQVDREGQMSSEGRPMVHPGIIELIYDNVHLEDGHYILRWNNQTCELEVADTFFVVAQVEVRGEAATLTLNDGRSEPLDPATLRIGGEDVLYCDVKGGEFPARFLRKAYYQLAQHVEPEGDGFVLALGQSRHPIAVTS